MPISYDDAITKYADVQGNILKGHGRDYAAFLFIEFGSDLDLVRAWLRDAVDGQGKLKFTVTTTKKQLEETRRFKKFQIPGDPFAMLLFTAAGLEVLGQAVPLEPNQVAAPAFTPAFARGMRHAETRTLLQDPDPTKKDQWDDDWFEPNTDQPTPLHALLIVADDDRPRVQQTAGAVADQLATGVGTLRVLEWGNVIRNDDGNGIEHFGYADGVSQPVYLVEDMPDHHPTGAKDNPLEEATDRWNPGAMPEEQVLVADPAGGFGSFFVFRKLQQQVRDFKQAEAALARRIGLAKGDEERAGAMLVGRFEDGTPVVERSTDGLLNPIVNNFNYAHDTEGLKCPFHAHIRKVNPRGETAAGTAPEQEAGTKQERLRQLTRRGIPFGTQAEARKEDGDPVGLLFMCFVRNIGQQYEFIQKFWANNPDFLFNKDQPGLDPIIGQGERDKLRFTYTYGAAGTRRATFEQFVTLRGGEYFYAPSLPGLRALAAPVHAPAVAKAAG